MVSLRPPSDDQAARRRRTSDYDEVCPHEPECFGWDSEEGVIAVCLMGDRHLQNALRMLNESWGGPNDDTYDLGVGNAAGAIEDELKLRGL